MINIVLVEPEIPQNTGNIIRTCATSGAKLHLIKPLGFDFSDKNLKRAGLDYFDMSEIVFHESLNDFFDAEKGEYFFATTKGGEVYSDVTYPKDCYLLFGKETKGLPEELLKDNYDRAVRIPMREGARSMNLSNAVAVIVYEVLRQQNFPNLQGYGHLTKF